MSYEVLKGNVVVGELDDAASRLSTDDNSLRSVWDGLQPSVEYVEVKAGATNHMKLEGADLDKTGRVVAVVEALALHGYIVQGKK